MKRDAVVYLQHILDAIAKTASYIEGIDEDTFRANSLIQDGVIRQIEIIGEATKRLQMTCDKNTPQSLGAISPGCATS